MFRHRINMIEAHRNHPQNFEIHRVDDGAVRFQVHFRNSYTAWHSPRCASFALASVDDPKSDLYVIRFESASWFLDVKKDRTVQFITDIFDNCFHTFIITWYNNIIQIHYVAQERLVPLVQYRDDQITSNNIGLIKFYITTVDEIQWLIQSLPPIDFSPKNVIFEDGSLHWVPMTNRNLPENAFIGGFEDEIIYVARSLHNFFMCPGKYVPSQHKAYVPWGGGEHAKKEFDILCGYNAKWVKTRSDHIPENAFIGGYSEVRREPLYIGRAMVEGNLITGKVHVLYSTCYLPYKGREVEVSRYEILVNCCATPRAVEKPTE